MRSSSQVVVKFISNYLLFMISVVILTYDRVDGVTKIFNTLRNCPFLNKVTLFMFRLSIPFHSSDNCCVEQQQ